MCRRARSSWALMFLGLVACTGSVSERPSGDDPAGPGSGARGGTEARGGAGGASGGTAGGPGGAGAAPVGKPGGPLADGAGALPVARLTREELENTLADLLGAKAPLGLELPNDARGAHGFLEATPASDLLVQRLLDGSSELAAAAVERMPAAERCETAASADACVAGFVDAFGKRAFRRPLVAAERAAFLALDKKAVTELKYAGKDRVRLLVRAFLMAPEFLYRAPAPAPAKAGATVALGGYELASRLSYALWRTMPDEALFAAADGGKLATPADIEKQARRLLADPRAQRTIESFHDAWLALEHLPLVSKDTKAFPAWTDKVRASIEHEHVAFLKGWVAEGATVDGLLTSTTGYVDAALAKIYGAPAPTGTALQKVALDPAQRPGLLTRAAFLATHADTALTKPSSRGKVLYEQLLCGTIPPPPLDVPEVKPAAPGLTTRERFSEHANLACAKGCHGLMDPMGFAFEVYDAVGGWRPVEAGKPVDATGAVQLPTEGERRFTSAVDLMKTLAGSDDVRRCIARKWTRFALGRSEAPAEAASIERSFEAFAKAKYDVRELLVALATSRAFLNRTVPEVTP